MRMWMSIWSALALATLALGNIEPAAAATQKPNILVIWGDDIGRDNISAYSQGIMGYQTPNIDRLAKEGALFTDSYAQQSCTAGRASFILGEHPFRTGLLTIGMPGSPQGIPDWAPTIADLLKAQGYATGQFGKNHLGDRDEHLPTVHGFDEFLGNLYHLNAEEEPETYYYPKDPAFRKEVRPARRPAQLRRRQGRAEDRGHRPADAAADDRRRPGDPRRASEFVDNAVKEQQALLRLAQYDPHARLDAPDGGAGRRHRHRPLSRRHGGARRDGRRGAEAARRPGHRREHHRHLRHRQRRRDRHMAGRRDDALQGREGHHLGGRLSRPDAGPLAGRVQAGHGHQRHLLAGGLAPDAARRGGRAGHRRQAQAGIPANGKTFRVHIDGYNFLPFFRGEVAKGPREEIFYFGQDGKLNAVRWNDWKVHFAVTHGNIATAVREVPGWPVIVNLRADPYEKAPEESGLYLRWYADNIWLFVPVQQQLKEFLTTLPQFPFQRGSSLNAAGINYDSLAAMQAMEQLKKLNLLAPPGD